MIHGIGDLHAGGVKRPRVSALLDDVKTLRTPALHLQAGDSTEHGLPEEDVLALRWLGRLPGPHRTILGNHDVMHNKRTPAQWAKVYGNESPNYVIDLPFLRIICVAPDRDDPDEEAGLLSDETLTWMKLRLERSEGRDCWIACHWPLRKTVLGDKKTHYRSDSQHFFAKPDGQDPRAARPPSQRQGVAVRPHALAHRRARLRDPRAARPQAVDPLGELLGDRRHGQGAPAHRPRPLRLPDAPSRPRSRSASATTASGSGRPWAAAA